MTEDCLPGPVALSAGKSNPSCSQTARRVLRDTIPSGHFDPNLLQKETTREDPVKDWVNLSFEAG